MRSFQPPVVGRTDHSKPALHNIPTPGVWKDSVSRIRAQFANRVGEPGHLSAMVDALAFRFQLKVGDLVVWAPISKPGLWRVIKTPTPRSFIDTDYAAIESRVMAIEWKTAGTNPCNEVTLENHGRSKLSPLPEEIVLEWFAGACGPLSNLSGPVTAPIMSVRQATEMEIIAIAATSV